MLDYMPFALGKAQDHRGLSASRSIDHFRAWLWMLSDDETLGFCDVEENYTNYGAPILREICENYGFDTPAETWFANMASGGPCSPDCRDGCGQGFG